MQLFIRNLDYTKSRIKDSMTDYNLTLYNSTPPIPHPLPPPAPHNEGGHKNYLVS